MSETILPCPVCGSPGLLTNYGLSQTAWAQCARHHAYGCIQGPVMPTIPDAVAAWNRIASAIADRDRLLAMRMEEAEREASAREMASRLSDCLTRATADRDRLAVENDELGKGLRRMQADNDVLRAQVGRLRATGDALIRRCAADPDLVTAFAAALAATAPTTGEEPSRG